MTVNNTKCHPLQCVNPCRQRVLKERRYFMYLLNTYDVINWTLRCRGGVGMEVEVGVGR